MKNSQTAGLALCLLAATGLAHASSDPLQVRSWAAACANCHGTNGQAQPGNEPLAGGNKDEMLKKLTLAVSTTTLLSMSGFAAAETVDAASASRI